MRVLHPFTWESPLQSFSRGFLEGTYISPFTTANFLLMGFWFIEHTTLWILNNSANPLLTNVSGGFVMCRLPTTHLSIQGVTILCSARCISAPDKHFLGP